jgi:hypothetical protein
VVPVASQKEAKKSLLKNCKRRIIVIENSLNCMAFCTSLGLKAVAPAIMDSKALSLFHVTLLLGVKSV